MKLQDKQATIYTMRCIMKRVPATRIEIYYFYWPGPVCFSQTNNVYIVTTDIVADWAIAPFGWLLVNCHDVHQNRKRNFRLTNSTDYQSRSLAFVFKCVIHIVYTNHFQYNTYTAVLNMDFFRTHHWEWRVWLAICAYGLHYVIRMAAKIISYNFFSLTSWSIQFIDWEHF